jgi:glycosidase
MGLDSAWLNHHPEFFIHKVVPLDELALSDNELQERYPGYFPYRTPSYPDAGGRVPKTIMVAYGRDPHFYPWIDTAQLDYARPELRRKMIGVLSEIAGLVDGVRCDMAMLVLKEQVKNHRHPDMAWETFNKLMPDEFWTEAIRSVRRINPRFVFMAETYWAMEGYLQHLGFDYTYNKPLYEAMCHAFHMGQGDGLLNFLRVLGNEFLAKSVHFLENHDEERAMNALGDERQRPAAAMLCTLPGVALLYQGQLEGKRERLPVQRIVPLNDEPPNESLLNHYRGLLKATNQPVFRDGRLHVLYSNNSAFVSYARTNENTKAIVIINSSNKMQKGIVSLMPNLQLQGRTTYNLRDLYYGIKPTGSKGRQGVQPEYRYPAAQLINQGLYVELHPYDAHIFMVEAIVPLPGERLKGALRHLNAEWSMPRTARRWLGATMVRSSDR